MTSAASLLLSRARRRLAAGGIVMTLLVVALGVGSPPAAALDGAYSGSYVGAPWFQPGRPYASNFPDPTVVRDGSTYWAFATSTGGPILPAMSSTDLGTWTARPAYSPNPYNLDPFFNDAFPVPPSWTAMGTSRDQAAWAPGIAKLQGSWVAYTAWETAPGRRCISVARSSRPQGPYVDPYTGPLVCDPDPAGSIDAEPFVDADGTPYLLWKATGVPFQAPTKLKARKLAPDGMSFAPGSAEVVLLQTQLPWEGNSIENPSMVRYGGQYWLTYSGDEWESASYRQGQARCSGPLGPCTRSSSQPLFGNTASDLGPAGGSFFVDATGRLRLAYAAWNAPYTSYPTNTSCDGPDLCASQGQRYLHLEGVVPTAGGLTVDPVGALDVVQPADEHIDAKGWALDPTTTAPIAVNLYLDGVPTAVTADRSRPDVGAAYPGLGANHGYEASIPAGPGVHEVCAHGTGVGTPANTLLGCRTVQVVSENAPRGWMDAPTTGAGSITATGWALDPDTSAPISVRVSVDATVVATVPATGPRPEAGASGHGYVAKVAAGPGQHMVCVAAVNVGPGSDALLGCRNVSVADLPPFGALDVASGGPGGLTVAGWAIDPDTDGPIDVHVYVDQTLVTMRADQNRPDLVTAVPGYGAAHGYRAAVPAGPGPHTVCAYGINQGPSSPNMLLGCKVAVVPNGAPFGSLDLAAGLPGSVVAAGWAIDPDTAGPIDVHVYVDGVPAGTRAERSRPDVAGAFPGYGAHGYQVAVPAGPGTHTVCAYGINVGVGGNALLACRVAVVPGGPPFGALDVVSAAPGGVTVAGWAIDPDGAGPIDVHVYVDGAPVATRADRSRPDVGAAFPLYGSGHGYATTAPAGAGLHTVCAYGINVGVGGNALLGCRAVVVG